MLVTPTNSVHGPGSPRGLSVLREGAYMPDGKPSGAFHSGRPGIVPSVGRRRKMHLHLLVELLPGRADWAAVRRNPRRDIVAGLSVAVVALPLALAYGASSGLGARAGLATAVVAGALAAIFGGGALQV